MTVFLFGKATTKHLALSQCSKTRFGMKKETKESVSQGQRINLK